ncbi:MAG: MFS transporter [Candidatus Dormibacteraeota bacterium]|nr:MFS transporter [Candidatus Dormibacteraeota bacterium]MBV9524276.1 MFS transporter [Candidatus Dormibacteraeota bacterium]
MTAQVTVEDRERRRGPLARLRRRRTGPARAGYRTLFRIRDYRLLFSGLTISMSGSWAYNVGLVVFVFNATHSPGWVAAASMTRFLTALIASPFAGLIADRMERVRLMITLDLLALVWQTLLAVTAALNGPIALAIGFAALTSLSTASYGPAARAATPAVVGEDHLAAANSIDSAVENLSIIVGPAIGAILLAVSAATVVFAVNAATFALSAVLVSRMRTRNQPGDITEGGTAGPFRQMAAGFRAFVSSPTVMLLAGFSILASFVYGTDTVLFVVVSKNLLGTGATGYGYLLAALGVGGILMAGFMNRVAQSRRLGAIIVAGMAVYCLPTAALPLVHAPAVAAVLEVVRGAGTIVVDVLAITALQRLVPSDVVARVFGVFFALVLAAISLGALLMPILLGAIGVTTTLLVMGFAIPALAVLAYPWIRALDSRAVADLAAIEPRVRMLEGLDIFAGATRAALERLARAARSESVAAGTLIIREGDVADDFFVLTAGEVDILARGEGDAERTLGVLHPPDYFGEIGLLGHRPRTATVRAATECVLYRIPGGEFVDALTVATLSPSALGSAQLRLARTHPSQSLTLESAPPPQ